MRIAHVTDCYLPRLGGIEVQVHDLATRQAAAGHDVTVVTSVGAGSEIRYWSSLRGRSAVLGGGFDVVHVHASTFSPLAFLTAPAAARRAVPTVVTVHSLPGPWTPVYRAADRVTRCGSWRVVWSAVSAVAAASLRRVLGAGAEVVVLPNGVEPSLWRADHVDAVPGQVRFVSVMRLAARKRPRQLLSVLRDARRRLPQEVRLQVEVAGDGPLRPALERYLHRHGMSDWVRLAGRLSREEVRALYARSDVYLAPATLESFGIAALEARTAGLPVVARRGTGVQDFVEHGREGLLVDSDDAMTDAVVGLASSPELRARLAAHNRSVPALVNWTTVLQGCDALYRMAEARQAGARSTRAARATGRLSPSRR